MIRKIYLKQISNKIISDVLKEAIVDIELSDEDKSQIQKYILENSDLFLNRIYDTEAKDMNLADMVKYFNKKNHDDNYAITKTCANKRCSHGQVFMFPAKNFYKNKRNHDGLNIYCKGCSKDDTKHYRKLVPKRTTKCGYPPCDVTFQTNTNKKYCCENHAYLFNLEKNDKKALFKKRNEYRKIRRSSQTSSNGRKIWSKEDIVYAREARLDGETWIQIGKALGRTESAVEMKINPEIKRFKRLSQGII